MIDYKFIEDLEGAHVLKGYIPLDIYDKPLGKSGVTISTGVDLGQMSHKELIQLFKSLDPVPIALLSKLLPYAELKQVTAQTFLNLSPLEITLEESKILSELMRKKILEQLIKEWTTYTHSDFHKLPSKVQTVLYSLAYNFGPALSTALPFTFSQFVKSAAEDDWSYAAQAMFKFPSKNKELETRRRKEALLLMDLVR